MLRAFSTHRSPLARLVKCTQSHQCHRPHLSSHSSHPLLRWDTARLSTSTAVCRAIVSPHSRHSSSFVALYSHQSFSTVASDANAQTDASHPTLVSPTINLLPSTGSAAHPHNDATLASSRLVNATSSLPPPPPRPALPPPPSNVSHRLRYLAAVLTALGLSAVIIRGPTELQSDVRVFVRFCRTAIAFVATLIDFKYTWYCHPEGSPAYRDETNKLHQRTADRLLALAQANRGLYIKSGQYICSMNHALPSQYINTLRPLQNDAPSMPHSSVLQLFAEEFPGQSIEQLYSEFDPTPIAAASIAQVHRARLPDGRAVAVKLQYPNLRKEFGWDLLAHFIMLKCTEFAFPRFHLSWVHDEIADNLTKELDFMNEAHNAELGRAHFARTGNEYVYVPHIDYGRTTRRVLTMEWVDGVKVNDRRALTEQVGITVKEAMAVTLSTLSEQIFLHAFVHCDPHPGNIFLRRTPSDATNQWESDDERQRRLKRSHKPFQVVILDWGLCRAMRESVRIHYCQLWQALILRRDSDVTRAIAALGCPADDQDTVDLLAMSILMRPYRASSIGLGNKLSKHDMQELRRTLEKKMDRWMDSFQLMPRELLLVLRNQNYLRSLNHEMGQPVNRFRIMARMAVRGNEYRNPADVVQQQRTDYQHTWNALASTASAASEAIDGEEGRRGWAGRLWERMEFEWSLAYSDVVRWVAEKLFWWWADASVKAEMEKMAKTAGEEGNPLFGG